MSDQASRNVETLRRLYQLWTESKGDSADEWLGALADQIHFRSLAMGQGPGASFTGPRSTKEEVRSYFEGIASTWEMLFYEVDEFIAQNDRVVVLASTQWRNRETGKILDTPKIDVFRLRDGKIVEFFECYDTAKYFSCACA